MPWLSLSIAIPLAAAALAPALPRRWPRAPQALALGASALPLIFLAVTWARLDTGQGLQLVEQAHWIPSIDVAWRVAVDGMSLVLSVLTVVLFLACIAYGVGPRPLSRTAAALLLLLEGSTLAFFLAEDFFLFYVAFDVTLVAMYFLIALWGGRRRRYAALKFFLYTLVGSLPVLLGLIALFVVSEPHTFDMIELIRHPAFRDAGVGASFVFFAFFVGFAIKAPIFPFHTWLPAAHVEAPTAGSVLLAGVLLKMGTYGFVRVNFQMLGPAFTAYALPLALLGLVSAFYGAFVALAQTDLKRLVAYTSINHMGYVLVGVAAAAAATHATARRVALDGAIMQMVAHGLVIAVLFLVAGFIQERLGTREVPLLGGLMRPMPIYGTLTALAFFAALGLPGLAQFPAELQIFLGTLDVYPAIAAVTVFGIVVTAALFLRVLQQAFLGPTPRRLAGLRDLGRRELVASIPLAALVVAVGVYPPLVLTAITSASRFMGAML